MVAKHKFMNWLKKGNRLPFLIIFCLLLVAHIFIFRDIVAQIPNIVSGKAVLVREELVPFFSSAQYWPDDTSALTGSDEIRVAYSFWTSWVRYYAVLPFAIVIMNALSAFILFYALYRIGVCIVGRRRAVIIVALLATIPIHFIMLYAKITHFYSLILGFSALALALSLVLEQLFYKTKVSRSNIAATSLLVLFNPAIHYHVIFYTVLVIILAIHLLVVAMMDRSNIKPVLKKDGIYALAVTAFSLVPYALFILLATSATAAAQNIPVNYYMIYHTSVPIGSLLSFDIASQVDMFRYGSYLSLTPRFTMAILFIAILYFFASGGHKGMQKRSRMFLVGITTLLLVSAWMSIGYSSSVSFHSLLADVAIALSHIDNKVTGLITQLLGVFINILRFPHRFEFVYFYAGGVLLMITLLWMYDWLRRYHKLSRGLVVLLLSTLVIVPMAITPDYRSVLTSGDFGKFLKVYPLSNDLKEIKKKLATTKDSSLFILPSMESGKELTGDNGTERYNFIDKFFIFYLNQPTIYYGSGADSEQKIKAYMVYRSIYDGTDWWQDILANNIGATHILVPKNTADRSIGITYMPGIDKAIGKALSTSDRYERVYDGKDYALYQLKGAKPQKKVLLNMSWNNLTQYLSNRHKDEELYLPIQQDSIPRSITLETDSPERSFYDLYGSQNSGNTFRPQYGLVPFMSNVTAGSNYLENALSMFALNTADGPNNSLRERVPALVNLDTPQFVATKAGGGQIRIVFKKPQSGEARLVLRGSSREKKITVIVDGQKVEFTRLSSDVQDADHIDFTYFVADRFLKSGSHVATIGSADKTIVVESLAVIPEKDIPTSFSAVSLPNLSIQQTSQPGRLDVHIGGK